MKELLNASTGVFIDNILNSLQHPFFMLLGGMLFWFTLMWSLKKDKLAKEGKTFIGDQKDEMIVTFIGGLLFLVWDDEVIQAYFDVTGRTGEPEMKIYYYLLVGPAVDSLYKLYRKVTHKNE